MSLDFIFSYKKFERMAVFAVALGGEWESTSEFDEDEVAGVRVDKEEGTDWAAEEYEEDANDGDGDDDEIGEDFAVC